MALSALLEAIARQEETLVLDRFDEDIAWRLGSLLREWANTDALPIVIDIGLFHRQLFFSALPRSTPDNIEWARRKRNVVERYHRSSYRVGRELAAKNDTLANRYGLPLTDFAEHGGGFPLTLAGAGVIGAAVVSGLPQRDDHQLVVRALAAVIGHDVEALVLPDG
ncbi:MULTISPECIES: heme-degrading domain-containing protein [unclassified Sphingomonas]|uniref:heme-degrading domain-containing protein n=1 Tax=unclassified Sphingomonas TaxID=196159 RepID=UPI0022698EEC|nr:MULTISPECIES: heme-degrading domain-containing protein [unclassified Sphingomonas]